MSKRLILGKGNLLSSTLLLIFIILIIYILWQINAVNNVRYHKTTNDYISKNLQQNKAEYNRSNIKKTSTYNQIKEPKTSNNDIVVKEAALAADQKFIVDNNLPKNIHNKTQNFDSLYLNLITTKLILIKNLAMQELEITLELERLEALLNNEPLLKQELQIVTAYKDLPTQDELKNILKKLKKEIKQELNQHKSSFLINFINQTFKNFITIKKIKNFQPNSLADQINLLNLHIKNQEYEEALIKVNNLEIEAENLILLKTKLEYRLNFFTKINYNISLMQNNYL